MSLTVQDLIRAMEELAAPDLAEPWDNVGLQLGSPDQLLSRVLLAVDVTKQVVSEAARNNVDALVSHHPLLFGGVVTLRRDRWPGSVAVPLIEGGRALYTAHTNLDWSPRANTSDALARVLGFDPDVGLRTRAGEGTPHLGVVVDCAVASVAGLAELAAEALGVDEVRTSIAGEAAISRAAIVAGSAKGLQEEVLAAGAQAVLAGEVGYHAALELAQLGVSTIEVGHGVSERPAMVVLAELLREALGGPIEVDVAEGSPLAGPTGGG